MTTENSSIHLYKHAYAENSYIIDHFTGTLLVSGEDLHEIYRRLNERLYPNPGYPYEWDVWPKTDDQD